MKKLLMSAVLVWAGVSWAGEIYSLQAELAGYVSGSATTNSAFVGTHGEVWTLGLMKRADSSVAYGSREITVFGESQKVNIEAVPAATGGFAKDGNNVPAILVNDMDSQAETFLGWLPAHTLCVHPDYPQNADTLCCNALRVTIPEDGLYRLSITVWDLGGGESSEYGTDGISVSLVAGDETLVDRATVGVLGKPTWNYDEDDLRLTAGGTVTLVVDPNAHHGYDSTVIGFTVERTGGFDDAEETVVADLNELVAANLMSETPSAEFSVGNLRVVSGVWAESGAFLSVSPMQNATLSCSGFGIDGSIPWMLANIGGSPAYAQNMGVTTAIKQKEFWLHPSTVSGSTASEVHQDMSVFVGVSAPSNGWYKAIGRFRDICQGESGSSNASGGAAVGIRTGANGPSDWAAASVVSAESGQRSVRLVAESLWLNAGEMVYFTVGSNGDIASDSTGLMALLAEGSPPSAAECVNVDFDGRQSVDAMPVTFVGELYYPGSGSFWNSVRGDDGASPVSAVSLRTSAGRRTEVSILMARDGNGGWDHNPREECNEMRDDYAYLIDEGAIDVVLSGLVPGGAYDLTVFSNNEDGSVITGGITHTVNRASVDGSGQDLYDILASALVADGDGELRFKLRTRVGGSGVSVYPGMQLRGRFPVRAGLVVIVK